MNLVLIKNSSLLKYRDYLEKLSNFWEKEYYMLEPFVIYVCKKYVKNTNIIDNFLSIINSNPKIVEDFKKWLEYTDYTEKEELFNCVIRMYIYFYEKNMGNELLYNYLFEYGYIEREEEPIKTKFIGRQTLDILIQKIVISHPVVNPYKIKCILYLCYYCGLTKHELMMLNREAINFKTGAIKLYNRTAYINKDLYPLFLRYFNSEIEVENAFNLTKGDYEKLNRKLRKIKVGSVYASLELIRDSFIMRALLKVQNPRIVEQSIKYRMSSFMYKYRHIPEIQYMYDKLIYSLDEPLDTNNERSDHD